MDAILNQKVDEFKPMFAILNPMQTIGYKPKEEERIDFGVLKSVFRYVTLCYFICILISLLANTDICGHLWYHCNVSRGPKTNLDI